MNCSLCKHPATFFGNFQNRTYNRCTHCASVFLDTIDLPSAPSEKQRYDKHKNSEDNQGYIQFLNPLIEAIRKNHSTTEVGLDFGSGPNPVLSQLLQTENFSVESFDPFFDNRPEVLSRKYDYIICCEVIEHFHNPSSSFQKLYNMLKNGGSLYCKTQLLPDVVRFEDWWYKNDYTHSFFYSIETLHYLKDQFNFSLLEFQPDYFRFIK